MKVTQELLNERPLSYSSIKEFAKSPRHYINYINAKRDPSKEMNMGSVIHTLLMYPSEFSDTFAVAPDVDRRTKEGKMIWEQFNETSGNKMIVSESDLAEANSIVDIVISSPSVSSIVGKCHSFEQEFRIDHMGLPYRGFVDGISDSFILEVKTMSDASPQNIIREFYNRKYHIQAALYSMVFKLPVKYIIIETKAPYNFIVADASSDYIDKGREELNWLSERFKLCMDLDAFSSGYQFNLDNVFEVGLPSWIK